ncbi:MAG: hypothetical protein ABIH89_04460 [Elusimicrobiota bacterium]
MTIEEKTGIKREGFFNGKNWIRYAVIVFLLVSLANLYVAGRNSHKQKSPKFIMFNTVSNTLLVTVVAGIVLLTGYYILRAGILQRTA